MLSAHESYSMDDISYHNLINCLESMTPFEAIRQAEEINKVNGFEVINKVVIAGWKKQIRKYENEKIKIEKIKVGQGESHFLKIGFIKKESRKLQKDYVEIKKRELQKGYMRMLNY